MDLTPDRFYMYILDVKGGSLSTLYRTRGGASHLANTVDALGNTILDDVDNFVIPLLVITTTIWGDRDEALIYNWYRAVKKRYILILASQL
jgi:hypothetical protein